MAKTFYQGCMNLGEINKLNLSPLLELMNEFGQWPILDSDWTERGYNWEKQVGELRVGAAVEGIIAVVVYVDMENSTNRMLTVSRGQYVTN